MKLPAVAWAIGTGNMSLQVTIGGNTQTTSIPRSSTLGFGVLGNTWQASSTSVAGRIASAINAHPSTVSVAAHYVVSDYTTGPAAYAISYTVGSGTPITLTFPSVADAAKFGFATASVTIPGTTYTTPYSPAGVWTPNGSGGLVYSFKRQRAAASSSNMAAAFTDVVGWGSVEGLRLSIAQMPAAFAFDDFASDSIYAAQANRNVADPNNTMELMLAAAAASTDSGSSALVITRYKGSIIKTSDARMPAVATAPAVLDHLSWTDEPRYLSGDVFFMTDGG